MPVLRLPIILACAAALITLSGCGGRPNASTDTTTAEGAAVLRWGADENGSAPFLYRDPDDPAKRVGFENEIAEELGKRLGRKMEFVQTAWDSLLPALNRGDFDIALSGIEITPSRKEQVAFSDPYYIATKQLVVRADSNINSLADLADRPVGTLMESTSEKYLRNTRCEVRTYDNAQLPYDDLVNGTVDGVLLDLPIAEFYTRPNKDLRMAGKPVGPGQYGIALRQKDQKLLNEVNAALASMKEDGSLQAILEKWNLWNNAQEPTTATVVANAD